MSRNYRLPIYGTRNYLEFEWDESAGTIIGRDAIRVLGAMLNAQRLGGVTTHPFPTDYEIHDPLHQIEEFATVLTTFNVWLEGDLKVAFKRISSGNTHPDKCVLY